MGGESTRKVLKDGVGGIWIAKGMKSREKHETGLEGIKARRP